MGNVSLMNNSSENTSLTKSSIYAITVEPILLCFNVGFHCTRFLGHKVLFLNCFPRRGKKTLAFNKVVKLISALLKPMPSHGSMSDASGLDIVT